MIKLTDRNWKAFKVTDVFDEIERGKRLKNADHIKGPVPYVASSALNNGVTDFVQETHKTRSFRNCISLANSGSIGTAFYEPFKFVASDHITHLKINHASQEEYLFLAATIEKQKNNFGFNREINDTRIKALKIMLPINDQNKPDFDFIRQYVIERKKIIVQRSLNLIDTKLKAIGTPRKISELSGLHWKNFRLGKLFDISRPKARSKSKYQSGSVPFVASGAVNNGVSAMLKPKVGEILDKGNCITISPVDGSTFYQPIDFLGRGGGGSSMIILRKDVLNEFNGQFLAKMIQHTFSKYSYGHMASSGTAGREVIMLPVDNQGQPDYQYMEQYIKNLMIQKYKQYLAIICQQKN